MRVYHFVNADYGLADISCRRLKVSNLNDLNDPFELLPACDEEDLSAFTRTKEEMAKTSAILCFSANWDNPVQWAHYGDRHKGVCLGFDVTDGYLLPINYSNCRHWFVRRDFFDKSSEQQQHWMKTLLYTKYLHWQYEDEYRVWLELSTCTKESFLGREMFFQSFSDHLVLREVVIGARSCLTREQVSKALGGHTVGVEVFRASPSNTEFKMLKILT